MMRSVRRLAVTVERHGYLTALRHSVLVVEVKKNEGPRQALRQKLSALTMVVRREGLRQTLQQKPLALMRGSRTNLHWKTKVVQPGWLTFGWVLLPQVLPVPFHSLLIRVGVTMGRCSPGKILKMMVKRTIVQGYLLLRD
jgi:hypothetical protein